MEWLSNYLVLVAWLMVILTPTLLLILKRQGQKRLPPGPPGWPLIGNLLDLGSMPHKSLAELKNRYGPVIWLRLGFKNTMVILSTNAATEFFKNHDLSFIDRSINEASRAHDYHLSSVALAPYGSYWRTSRRLLTVDMLVNKRINETASIRQKCVDDMLTWVEEETRKLGEKRGIHLARFVFLMSFNLLGNLMLSRDFMDPKSKDGLEFFTVMERLMTWSGYANMADYFPWLRRLDPQGVRRKMDRDLGKAVEMATKFVKERVKMQELGREKGKDFLDVLLEFEGNGKDEPAKLSERDINIFILEIFLAGSETTSSTIEWALTELLLNPDSMSKAKTELSTVIGPNKKIQEADIENLPYLQAVLKETLRLHPPIPFLIPRKAIKNSNFMGYHIPKHTQVLINVWAIGRDPEVWSDPFVFKPERFVGSKVEYKGQNYEFIPFGAGRRMCAGVPLAHRVLHLVMGSLLHHFDWEFDAGVTAETLDMNDKLGISMRKLVPLSVIPKKSFV